MAKLVVFALIAVATLSARVPSTFPGDSLFCEWNNRDRGVTARGTLAADPSILQAGTQSASLELAAIQACTWSRIPDLESGQARRYLHAFSVGSETVRKRRVKLSVLRK